MFRISTLPELTARARSAFRAYLPGTDAWLWPNNIGPTAKVIAGGWSEVFGMIDYVARQKFAGTADGENLDLHGQELGLGRRPKEAATGKLSIVVADAYAVDNGAVFQRTDGVRYATLASAAIAGPGTLVVDAVAQIDGASANANGGTPLAPVSGVSDTNGTANPVASVEAAGMVGGKDVEPDGEFWTTDLGTYRGRILFRKRNPPHGGNPADYVQWASDVTGVTRVFVERRWNGAGTVRVFALMDDLYPNGIPPTAEVERVQAYIETVAPSVAIVTVAAPTPVPVDVTISGLTPNTATVQEAVKAELASAFLRNARPAGIDTVWAAMPFLAVPTTFSRSWIWQAVANASGEERHSITTPAADVALASGQMPTLGNVTFV